MFLYLAPVVSPRVAHACLIHQEYGKVKVVFIGILVLLKKQKSKRKK